MKTKNRKKSQDSNNSVPITMANTIRRNDPAQGEYLHAEEFIRTAGSKIEGVPARKPGQGRSWGLFFVLGGG